MELFNMWRIQSLIEKNRDMIIKIKELERKLSILEIKIAHIEQREFSRMMDKILKEVEVEEKRRKQNG